MAINRPTGEQIRFVSTKTGDHILDTYMEMVERGNRTLYELLDDIYDPYTGEIHDDFIQLRIDPTTQRLQIRIGQYLDPNLGWENTPNYILRHRGAWTPSTAYELLDIVTANNYSYICTTPHTSSTTINTTNFKLLFDADFIENYAIAAAGSAATALSHSNTSLSHANSSNSARLLSESARDASQLAQSLSESARNDSQAAQSLSESARDASVAAKLLSESARDKAQKWAEEAEDAPVEAGQFSAKHWAAKASYYGGDKLTKAGDAMTGLLTLAAGADIASASTIDLTAATGNCPKITGTTPVVEWVMNTGQQMKCIAEGALPLTYHATTNNIEGGANYTCSAGDIISLVKSQDGVIRVRIDKQDGTAVVAPPNAPVGVGEIFDWPHASTPSYGLLCNGAQVSRTTYSALFAAIGTTWGAGNGSTTFNIPNIPAGYTTVQANGNEGSSTVGQNLSHGHTLGYASGAWSFGDFRPTRGNSTLGSTSALAVDNSGGAANLAAGVRVRKCIRF